MPIVSVRDVSKVYGADAAMIQALQDVSFTLEAGQFAAITGPSGSGKSTLLNLMGCIEKPSSGKILIEGADVTAAPLDELAALRAQRMGYIFQTFNLLPILTVTENVSYPLWLAGASRDEAARRASDILAQVGLQRWSGHKPKELSGGQRQRVAIARALIAKPAMVLADEPTANLDRQTGLSILKLMKDLNRSTGITFIFATHDPEMMALADRIVELRDGRILKDRTCT